MKGPFDEVVMRAACADRCLLTERLRAQVGGHHDDGLNLREHGFGVDLRDLTWTPWRPRSADE
jgi:hypothetical protein